MEQAPKPLLSEGVWACGKGSQVPSCSPPAQLACTGYSPSLPPCLAQVSDPLILTHPPFCTWNTPVPFLPSPPQACKGSPVAPHIGALSFIDSMYHSLHIVSLLTLSFFLSET